MTDYNVCPDCWAERTLHDPFPSWAYVAPCHMHIVDSGFCMGCGGPLNADLECMKCTGEKLMDRADELRKEEKK